MQYEKMHTLDVYPGYEDMMPHVKITIEITRASERDYGLMQSLFCAVSDEYKRICAKRLKERRQRNA